MESTKPKKKYNYYVKKEKPLETFNEKTKKSAYKPQWEFLPEFRGEFYRIRKLMGLEKVYV